MSREFRLTTDVLSMIRTRISLGDFDWEIAGRIGCDLNTLHNICSAHGYELRCDLARYRMVTVANDDDTIRAFAAEAAVRNTTAQQLMARCLRIIAHDGLYRAILGK